MNNEHLSLYLGSFVDELVRAGLKHIVVSPGSRSTPLAVLAAEHPKLKVWLQIDERSAGFFALGIAKITGEAVALLCTSGTAAANYMPAVAEANLSRIPLIVLTADRPHELRDVGAPQTIDQLSLYGSHAKWFMEMPLPEHSELMLKHARVMAARAVHTALSVPNGVVHLNFPLREPLMPDLSHPQLFSLNRKSEGIERVSYTQTNRGELIASEKVMLELAEMMRAHVQGVIIVGPQTDMALLSVVQAFADALQYPVLVDPLSHLRSGHTQTTNFVATYDSFLRDEHAVTYLKPTLFIRIGAMPVSKPLLQYMNRYSEAEHIVIDEAGWRDPTLLISHYVQATPRLALQAWNRMFEHLNYRRDEQQWIEDWLSIQEITATILHDEAFASHNGALFEGRVVTELQQLMRPEDVLFVGNSMPIRDVDTFYRLSQTAHLIYANRGANGIDGLVSTAMGMAAVTSNQHVTLLLGDLSFYHDLNGLLSSKLHGLDITVIVINNDGGGIFSFLPQASEPKHFETLFGTPIGLNYEHVVKMYDGQFTRVSSWTEFASSYKQSRENGGLQVIEVPTVRQQNVELHRQIWPKLSSWLTKYIASRG